MKKITDKEQSILKEILRENHLTEESILYRYTSKKYIEIDENRETFLTAKAEPLDMVVDQYHGQYHVFIAHEIGAGLAFMKKPEREYENPQRVCVAVTLKDIIDQGGLVYSVSSLPSYIKAFFFTLPEGKVRVKQL